MKIALSSNFGAHKWSFIGRACPLIYILCFLPEVSVCNRDHITHKPQTSEPLHKKFDSWSKGLMKGILLHHSIERWALSWEKGSHWAWDRVVLPPTETERGQRIEWQSQCTAYRHSAPHRSAVKREDLDEQHLWAHSEKQCPKPVNRSLLMATSGIPRNNQSWNH